MPQGVEAVVFGLTRSIDNACLDQRRLQDTRDDIVIVLDVAPAIGKDQIMRALRTGELPFLQRIQNKRAKRDRALA